MRFFLRFILALFIIFICYGLYIFFSFNPKSSLASNDPFYDRYSKSVFDRDKKILSIFLNNEEQWHIKEDENISKKFKIAILNYEDKNFYSHIGFDILAIFRSLYNNLSSDKRSGASTITMQTIKILTKQKRTYFNKFKEIVYAIKLETLYSKDEILQMYINNAPYGGNIVGAKTAAYLYFNKNINNLTWGECALLAILPNAPGLMHLSKNTNILIQKRNKLLMKLKNKGYIDENNLMLAMNEKLPKINRDKNIAPHLSIRLANELNDINIYTTINKNIQLKLESHLKSYHQRLVELGIENVSAIIVDTKTSQVLAYAGSQDFFDIDGYGQIDGIKAKRSPGSVLKPLLYALAIDDGLITEQSKLIDAPTFFSNFKPQNASKKYYGLISARFSLIQSLNVPFVSLLQDYGYERFFFKLKDILNFKDNDFKRYGLSLILGTKEISVEDVAKIYLGFGNYGEFGDLSYLMSSKNNTKKRILTKGSSYLTLDAMRYLNRFGLENYYKNKKIISWKTGTSYGRKDAWAAGTSPKYTIVLWAGNFNGESNPNLFGVNIAGDLLFNILGDLGDLGGEFDIPKESLKDIKIDSITGYRYSSDYKNIPFKETLYPNDAKNLRKSPFLKNIFVNQNGEEINSINKDFINAKELTRLSLPLNLLEYYREQNINISQEKIKKNLKFLYPKNNLKIIRTKDFEGNNELIIRIANINNNEVFWYLDKNYIGSSFSTTRAIDLDIGFHTLTIINTKGESDSIKFNIIK
ncbi:penicillin-binding protein 1C [Helicobacter sp. MIT 14-3879]|uniref:penicillin-binding protein 1C n=1 Tax=Helicobacter sp. MIT 14-3879 TaxID=2040649 RepID=UPI000E1E7641|nr:penicillin-binding protein 1C [Helicobacter sp. MIT 14-3879]